MMVVFGNFSRTSLSTISRVYMSNQRRRKVRKKRWTALTALINRKGCLEQSLLSRSRCAISLRPELTTSLRSWARSCQGKFDPIRISISFLLNSDRAKKKGSLGIIRENCFSQLSRQLYKFTRFQIRLIKNGMIEVRTLVDTSRLKILFGNWVVFGIIYRRMFVVVFDRIDDRLRNTIDQATSWLDFLNYKSKSCVELRMKRDFGQSWHET